jgi:hypothetical protein
MSIACLFVLGSCWGFIKSHKECPPTEFVIAILMAQIGMGIGVAVFLARLRYPERAVKLKGIVFVLGGILCVIAAILDGMFCRQPLRGVLSRWSSVTLGRLVRGVLSYAVFAPQAFIMAYVCLCDESIWLPVCFYGGCTFVLVGVMNSYLLGEGPFLNVIGMGSAMFAWTVFSRAWHHALLFRAKRALRPFRKQYDDAWKPIKETQQQELLELAAFVRGHPTKRKAQVHPGIETLMKVSRSLNPWYQVVVASWAKELGLTYEEAPLKKRARVLEKVERSYKGDVQQVLDLVRASIIVNTVQEARQALELVLCKAGVSMIKCRYDLDYDGEATNGYRDINMQLCFSELRDTPFEDFVFELQIVLSSFFKIKSEGQHEKYIHCRNLRGN